MNEERDEVASQKICPACGSPLTQNSYTVGSLATNTQGIWYHCLCLTGYAPRVYSYRRAADVRAEFLASHPPQRRWWSFFLRK